MPDRDAVHHEFDGFFLRGCQSHDFLGGLLPGSLCKREIARHGEALNVPRGRQEGGGNTRRRCRKNLFVVAFQDESSFRILCHGVGTVYDLNPATGLNVLTMEEAKHGVEIRLKDFHRFPAQGRIQCSLGTGIQVIVQKQAAQRTIEAEGGDLDLKEGIKGSRGESIEDFLGDTCDTELVHGNALVRQILLDGIDGKGCFFFRESQVHGGLEARDVAPKGPTRFGGAEEMQEEFATLGGGRGLLLSAGLNLSVFVGDRFIGEFDGIFRFGLDAHVTCLDV